MNYDKQETENVIVNVVIHTLTQTSEDTKEATNTKNI